MAKKPAKKKRTATVSDPPVTPRRPKRVGPAKVPLGKIVHFVRLLQNRKRAAKFCAHAKNRQASFTLSGASRIAIHEFLEKHGMLADACPTPDPWNCPED